MTTAPIYLDFAASAPLSPAAADALRSWLDAPAGNPASSHHAGRHARRALEDAREGVATLLDAHPDEVVFTSGATEANNLAILGLAGAPPGRLIASPVEHPCVAGPLAHLADAGFLIEMLPVEPDGRIPADTPLPADARIAAVMLANHETGTLQPVAELADRLPGVAFHCDAAQAIGKMPVSFRGLGVTTLAASGHKFGGPAGIGILLVRRGTHLRALFHGGHQQHGRRPGTEPVALAVACAAALRDAVGNLDARAARVRAVRERLLTRLTRDASPITVNGAHDGLPHILNLSFPGCRSDALLVALDLAGVACSAGSACSSGSSRPSPVLRAMGVPGERLTSAVRFSFDSALSEADAEEAGRRVAAAVSRLRATS